MIENKITKVIKRDETIVPFNQEKITDAIFAAAHAVGGTNKKIAERVSDSVVKMLNEKYSDENPPNIENIQDCVEKQLIEHGHARTAKAYIVYRKQHMETRDFKALVDSTGLVEAYIDMSDWYVKENANMAYSLQGLNNYISSTIVSKYWLEHLYPPEIANAHTNGDLHLHDLSCLAAYCCGWELRDILLKGFGGVPGKVESKPPKHFRTALGQLVNFLYTLQGETAGAEAVSNFDTYLAPFIRYDNLTYKEVKQALQEFLFNMNVPTRVGFQTPFTNVTLDLVVPSYAKDESVVIGGVPRDEKYGDFQKEMDMFNIAFAEVLTEGDAKGRVFTFPIPTYNITTDFDWNGEVCDKVMEMTAKYGIPYFSNFINSDMKPEDARAMCCRLRIDNRELKKRGGGLFGANPLTGSIGVVTVNMARIGYLTKGKGEAEFFKQLDKVLELAKESLIIKRKIVEKFTNAGLYPYARVYLGKVKETFGQYWKNHFSTIGIIGLNEATLNFMEKNITTEEGRKFGLKVMEHIRQKLADYQEEIGDIFNLEATPGEGTTYRLAKIDKKQYPEIIVANEKAVKSGAEPYYTNSSHLPVNFTDDIFEALELEDAFQVKYTGGTVLHGFVGEKMPSVESTKKLVKKIAENFALPYFTITPTFSVCPSHGYLAGEHKECPKCKEDGKKEVCEIYSRVVGYLRPIEQWNPGKRAEFSDRKTFDKILEKNIAN